MNAITSAEMEVVEFAAPSLEGRPVYAGPLPSRKQGHRPRVARCLVLIVKPVTQL